MTRALAAACALAMAQCARRAPPTPPLAALARLHDALAAGDPSPAVDPVTLARAELLARLALMHDIQHEEASPLGITDAGWRSALDDVTASLGGAGLRREFAPARALLGTGRCAETSPAPLPDALAPVTSPRRTWPAFVLALREDLARRAARAHAGVFRCDGGAGAFRAVFVPTAADDERLAVARITTAR